MNLLQTYYKNNKKGTSIVVLAFLYLFPLSFSILMGLMTDDSELQFISIGMAAFCICLPIAHILSRIINHNGVDKKLLQIQGFQAQRFMRESERCPQVDNLLMTTDAICYIAEGLVRVIPLQDIIWVYQADEGKKNKKSTQIVIRTRANKTITLPIKNKKIDVDIICRYMFRLIRRRRPSAFIGYKDEWEQLSITDFERFRKMAYQLPDVSAEELEMIYIQNNFYQVDFN